MNVLASSTASRVVTMDVLVDNRKMHVSAHNVHCAMSEPLVGS